MVDSPSVHAPLNAPGQALSGGAVSGPLEAAEVIRGRIFKLKEGLQDGLIGCEALVERLLIGLLSGGHLLVEGMPGLAKTRAVKRLAEGLESTFHRIQCTPDLMPADITGTPIWQPDRGGFEFAPGPVFASLVLVDEINRAPPKVQSALLEAMAERQVTAGGETHKLPDPFMVVATQNPIDQEGTFPLPEAQLDRFLMHVVVGLPNAASERKILDLVEAETVTHSGAMAMKLSLAEVRAARDAAMRVHLSPALIQPISSDDVAAFMADITLGAPVNGVVEIAGPDRMRLSDLVQKYLTSIKDPRKVVADAHARYFGAELKETTLVPVNGKERLGAVHIDAWLNR